MGERENRSFINPIASSFAVLGSRSTGQESAGRSQPTDNLALAVGVGDLLHTVIGVTI